MGLAGLKKMKTHKRQLITELGPVLMFSQKIMTCHCMLLKMLSMSSWVVQRVMGKTLFQFLL